MKRVIGYIDGDDGNTMAICYNGAHVPMTAEEDNGYTEDVDYTPKSLQDARKAASIMWRCDVWHYRRNRINRTK